MRKQPTTLLEALDALDLAETELEEQRVDYEHACTLYRKQVAILVARAEAAEARVYAALDVCDSDRYGDVGSMFHADVRRALDGDVE